MVVRLDLHQDVDRLVAASAYTPASRRRGRSARAARLRCTAALSLYADSTPRGLRRVRVADHREQRLRLRSPSMIQSALKILWRQCSRVRLREHHQLDVGRIARRAARRRRAGSRSRRRRARGRAPRWPRRARRCAAAPSTTRPSGRGACVREQRGRASDRVEHSVSVMRSYSGARAPRAPSRASGRVRLRSARRMPRSMRRTAASPQTCAMSVALRRPRRDGARTRHRSAPAPPLSPAATRGP